MILVALSFVAFMLKLFLTSADRGISTHAHLAQPLQKILLNHLHLIALAGTLPLRLPTSLFFCRNRYFVTPNFKMPGKVNNVVETC